MGGISAGTANAILYGTDAYFTVDGTDFGATEGDVEIEMTQELYYPDFAQALGPVAGTGRVIAASGRITVTMAEMKYASLQKLSHVGYSSDASSEYIGKGDVRYINEVNQVIVTGASRNDGKAFMAVIPVAVMTNPITLGLSKSKESSISVTFEARYELTTPQKMPMYIAFAK